MNDDRLARLEARLEELEARFSTMESRLASKNDTSMEEAGLTPRPLDRTVAPDAEPTSIATDQISQGPSVITLIGRLLLFLGGAFLVRALTKDGALPASIGVTLGILYGMMQLMLVERAMRKGGSVRNATWLGLGSTLIVFPLLFEATHEFQLLDSRVAALLLPFLCLLGIAVSTRHDLRGMAWIFMASAGLTGLVLAAHSGFAIEFPLAVLCLGLGGLWLGYMKHWHGLALVGSVVPLVLTVAVTVLLVTGGATNLASSLSPRAAMTLQLGLVFGFLGSYFARALATQAPVGIAEITQSFFAMFIGIGGALVSGRMDSSLLSVIGPLILAAGLFCYVAAFLFIDKKGGHRTDFAFFTTVALVATIAGGSIVMDGVVLMSAFIGSAVALALAGWRFRRATLSLHAASYVLAASFAVGAMGLAIDALAGAMPRDVPGPKVVEALLVALIAVFCGAMPVVQRGRTWGRLSRMPRALYLFVIMVLLDGMLTLLFANLLALTDSVYDMGKVAAIRTSIFAISAIALGGLAQIRMLREAILVVPVALAFGALSLLFGDIPLGRPSTQFASMALYGLALILGPSLARSARRDAMLAAEQ